MTDIERARQHMANAESAWDGIDRYADESARIRASIESIAESQMATNLLLLTLVERLGTVSVPIRRPIEHIDDAG